MEGAIYATAGHLHSGVGGNTDDGGAAYVISVTLRASQDCFHTVLVAGPHVLISEFGMTVTLMHLGGCSKGYNHVRRQK